MKRKSPIPKRILREREGDDGVSGVFAECCPESQDMSIVLTRGVSPEYGSAALKA